MADYKVWVHTSHQVSAGTDGRVAIELHGERGDTGIQWLGTEQDTPFGRGKVIVSLDVHVANQSVQLQSASLYLVYNYPMIQRCVIPVNNL